MPEGAEYPKAIYRDGGADLVWGQPVETSAANSAEEERAAIASGWRLSPIANPLDHDGNGKAGGSIDELDQKDTEELRALASERRLKLHHKTGRDKLLLALRGEQHG